MIGSRRLCYQQPRARALERYYHRNNVPKNILHKGRSVTDPFVFALLEKRQTNTRAIELAFSPLEGFTPNFEGFKAVHHYIFQDTYEWAGKTRADEVTILDETFTPALMEMWTRRDNNNEITAYFQGSKDLLTEAPIQIDRHDSKFTQAAAKGQLDLLTFAELTADLLEDMNYAHPFADGNGRALRGFLIQFGFLYGFNIDLSSMTKDEWIGASILSAEGLPDSMIALVEGSAEAMTVSQKAQRLE